MEYAIFTAPIPPTKRIQAGPMLIAIRKLQVGECFIIPNATRSDANNALIRARKVGIKIVTRKVEGGLQVWRIADEAASKSRESESE